MKLPILNNLTKKFTPWNISLILLILLVIVASFTGLFEGLEHEGLDIFFRLRGEKKVDSNVEIVFIGNESLKTLGRLGDWNRKIYGGLLRILSHYGAKATCFDILFAEGAEGERSGGDAVFKAQTQLSGIVHHSLAFTFLASQDDNDEKDEKKDYTLIEKFALRDDSPLFKNIPEARGVIPPYKDFAEVSKGIGFINAWPDKDGIFRHIPLLIRFNGKVYPSLSLQVVIDYLGIEPDSVKIIPGQFIILETKKGRSSGKLIKIPIDKEGKMLINYAGGIKSFKATSFLQVLQSALAIENGKKPVIDLAKFKDKIIMVGLTAEGTVDLKASPFSSEHPMVCIHANIIHSVITGDFIKRPHPGFKLAILFFLILLSMASFLQRNPLLKMLSLVAIVSAYFFLGYLLFVKLGLWLDIFSPLILVILISSMVMFQDYVEGSRILNLKFLFDEISGDGGSTKVYGQKIDKYKVISELGRGGMAIVFKCRAVGKGTVALKVLSPQLSHNRKFIARFHREAEFISQLSHPNIIRIYEIGEKDNIYYFTMEYVDGPSLAELINKGDLTFQAKMDIMIQSAKALAYVHERGIIHRDLKPGNILLTKDGQVKISDFGLSFTMQGITRLTLTATALGTPKYMSPEQCAKDTIPDVRMDIYSLGIIFYEMMVGYSPFQSESIPVLMRMHIEKRPTPPRLLNPSVPKAIDDIIMKALEKNPTNRFQSVEEIAVSLDDYLKSAREKDAQGGPETAD